MLNCLILASISNASKKALQQELEETIKQQEDNATPSESNINKTQEAPKVD